MKSLYIILGKLLLISSIPIAMYFSLWTGLYNPIVEIHESINNGTITWLSLLSYIFIICVYQLGASVIFSGMFLVGGGLIIMGEGSDENNK